jgi:hypothetical protein
MLMKRPWQEVARMLGLIGDTDEDEGVWAAVRTLVNKK